MARSVSLIAIIFALAVSIASDAGPTLAQTSAECSPAGPGKYDGKPADKDKKGTDGKPCGTASSGSKCQGGACTLGPTPSSMDPTKLNQSPQPNTQTDPETLKADTLPTPEVANEQGCPSGTAYAADIGKCILSVDVWEPPSGNGTAPPTAKPSTQPPLSPANEGVGADKPPAQPPGETYGYRAPQPYIPSVSGLGNEPASLGSGYEPTSYVPFSNLPQLGMPFSSPFSSPFGGGAPTGGGAQSTPSPMTGFTPPPAQNPDQGMQRPQRENNYENFFTGTLSSLADFYRGLSETSEESPTNLDSGAEITPALFAGSPSEPSSAFPSTLASAEAMRGVGSSLEGSIQAASVPASADTETAQRIETAKAELVSAQESAVKLQEKIESGTVPLGEHSAAVQQKAGALDESIHKANQALADSTLSPLEKASLLESLVQNVQNGLADIERELERATTTPPPTLAEAIFSGIGNAISSIGQGLMSLVQLSVNASLTLSGFIQNIWHALFPTL